MGIIITNDDGIDVPGIRALYAALDGKNNHRSQRPPPGCSHRVTTHKPLKNYRGSREEIAKVHGTPADCSRIGISHLEPNADRGYIRDQCRRATWELTYIFQEQLRLPERQRYWASGQ